MFFSTPKKHGFLKLFVLFVGLWFISREFVNQKWVFLVSWVVVHFESLRCIFACLPFLFEGGDLLTERTPSA